MKIDDFKTLIKQVESDYKEHLLIERNNLKLLAESEPLLKLYNKMADVIYNSDIEDIKISE